MFVWGHWKYGNIVDIDPCQLALTNDSIIFITPCVVLHVFYAKLRLKWNSPLWNGKVVWLWFSSATSTFQKALLEFGVEKIVAWPKQSMYSTIHGMREESEMVTCWGFRSPRKVVLSFLGSNTKGAAHSVRAGSTTSIFNILSILGFAIPHVREEPQCASEWTECSYAEVKVIQWLEVLSRPKCPSYICYNPKCIFKDVGWYGLWSSDFSIFVYQLFFSCSASVGHSGSDTPLEVLY